MWLYYAYVYIITAILIILWIPAVIIGWFRRADDDLHYNWRLKQWEVK